MPGLSFGASAIGNLFERVTGSAAERTVCRALELGLRYLDVAPHYGLGLAERRLGQVLATRPRQDFVISTKVGRLLRPRASTDSKDAQGFVDSPSLSRRWDFSRAGIRASVEESLERLQLDRVDIVYLHDPDRHEREVYETGYPALKEMRDEGIVSAIGAGMNQAPMLTRFVDELDFDVVLVAGRQTLLDQSASEALLPLCQERGVDVVAGGVYNSGILANPHPDAMFDYNPASAETYERVALLQEVCARHGVSLKAAALQFPLRHPAVVSVLASGRTPVEVDENYAAFHESIPTSLWEELNAFKLLFSDGSDTDRTLPT